MAAIVTTFGFSSPPDKVGVAIGHIGEARTVGYAAHGAAGMLTLFVRGMLCNWMVSAGVVGAMISTHVSGKVIACPSPDNLRQVHCKPKVFVAGTRCDARLEAPRWPIGRPGESHDQIASSVGHWHARRASGRFYLRLRTIEVGGPFKAMVAKQDVWTEAVTITVAPP
jgi:hypothetical protein